MTTSANVERRRLRARLAAIIGSTALCTGLGAPAFAESPHPLIDANSVDLVDGTYNLSLPIASVGSGQARLDLIAHDGQTDNWSDLQLTITTVGSVTHYILDLGRRSDNFTNASTVSTRGTNATLTTDSYGNYIYSTLEGTVITFGNPAGTYGGASNLCDANNTTNCALVPTKISVRGGMETYYNWDIYSVCTTSGGGGGGHYEDEPTDGGTTDCSFGWRVASVSNKAGYSINWAYSTGGTSGSSPAPSSWYVRTGATLKNGTTTTGTVSYANPSSNVYTVTAPGGGVWRITGRTYSITGVRRPSASSDTTSISYNTGGDVTSVTRDGITTGYSRSVSGSTATMVVTDALSNTTTVVSDLNKYRPTSVTDGLSRTTTMSYDSIGRPTEIVYPEGDKVQYAYDSRGNLTTTTRVAKSGSGLSNIVTSASFPSSCTDAACNEPTTTTDALGNVTDYSYNGTTGLVTAVTAPAPTSGATRPETRYTYTANSAGVYNLTGISQCLAGTSSACSGTANERVTTLGYDSNLNVTSQTVAAGDSNISATTAATYTAAGDLATVDGPLSGSSDTATFRYDADRNRVGAISPDPDGSGSLKHRAVKTTYNADGQPTVVELGNVNGTSDSDWAGFASAQQSTVTYDGNARKTKQVVTASSTTYNVVQYGYDGDGRLQCTALRMNSSTWSSLPSSACSLGTAGSFGDDRISKTTYDAAGQVTKVQSAYGTSAQSDEVTRTFNSNGTVATETDAEGNKTSYTYDGVDRLVKVNFPSTSKGAGTSASGDYEQYTLNAAGQITSRRLRDGNSIGFTYDALGRVTYKDLPSSEPDVTTAYDLLNEPTSIATSSQTLTFGYDALGRLLSQGGPLGTMTSQYDAAGRRTRLTWPDSNYVTYDRLVTGEITIMKENGSSTAASGTGDLMHYGYDDLGRLTGIARGNGTQSAFSYNGASQLTALSHDLGGSSKDVSWSYSYDPASGIASSTRNNDAYAWGGAVNLSRSYTSNGLNQYSAAGGTSLSYDARGNLTASGSNSYGYTSENLLISGPSSVTLSYDPAMRLYQTSGSATTRFQYDGVDLVAEYNSSNSLQRRYVPGAQGTPAVWYEGSGLGSPYWLETDERGSVVGLSDAAGTPFQVNSYDEYGIPASGNYGRFGYTGQTWLPDLGMWYYKARMYSPTLGRFMQTDPIGYGDGMNWYNYVTGDPVNLTDPTGLKEPSDDDASPAEVVVVGSSRGGGVSGSAGGRFSRASPTKAVVPVPYEGPTPEEVVVTATRKRDYSHYYSVSRRLTRVGTTCTFSQISNIVNANSVPGSPGMHSSGSNYRVSTAFGISPGHIQFQASADGRTFANVTLDDHWLRYGSVVTTISGNQDEGFVATVVGSGNNTSQTMAWLNEEAGPDIFKLQLSDMQMAALGACGG